MFDLKVASWLRMLITRGETPEHNTSILDMVSRLTEMSSLPTNSATRDALESGLVQRTTFKGSFASSWTPAPSTLSCRLTSSACSFAQQPAPLFHHAGRMISSQGSQCVYSELEWVDTCFHSHKKYTNCAHSSPRFSLQSHCGGPIYGVPWCSRFIHFLSYWANRAYRTYSRETHVKMMFLNRCWWSLSGSFWEAHYCTKWQKEWLEVCAFLHGDNTSHAGKSSKLSSNKLL